MGRQHEVGIQVLADGEILENKEIKDYKMEFKVRVETEMMNQEMKKDLGEDLFLNLQNVFNSLKQSLRWKKESLQGDSIL